MATAEEELAESVRRLLQDKCPLPQVRASIEHSEASTWYELWRVLADMGVLGLAVPGRLGGEEAGWSALVRVFEEAGRALTPGPLLGTVGLALPTLLLCGQEDAVAELVPGIIAGETPLAYAVAEPGTEWQWDLSRVACAARQGPDGWRLDGEKDYVLGALDSGQILVLAQVDDRLDLFVVDREADTVEVTERPGVDQTRPIHRLTLRGAPGRRVGRDGTSTERLRAALDLGRLAVAAEALGAAQACLDMAVGYARSRRQFGRAIGSFQSIKHLCADLLIQVEGARSAVYAAASEHDQDSPHAGAYACLAKAAATNALSVAAAANIQIHGALGFTWEHDAHLYYRRSIVDNALLGDRSYSKARMATLLGV